MTLAVIVVVCIVLLVLGFLFRGCRSGRRRAWTGRSAPASARAARRPGPIGKLFSKMFGTSRKATNKSASTGPQGARQDAGLAGRPATRAARPRPPRRRRAARRTPPRSVAGTVLLGRRSVAGRLLLGSPSICGIETRSGGVVGGVQDVVGELADVLDQPLALLPEDASVEDDLLRVGVGLLAQQLRLALGSLDAPLRLGARAGGYLLGGLVGALEDAGGLLADLGDRLLDDRFLRLAGLEVADDLDDLLQEARRRPRGRNRASPPGTCGSRVVGSAA